MDPKRWKQIDSLVDAALDVREGERDAFIKQSAHGDADLERAVLELLAAQGQSNEFLQHSAMRIIGQAIAVDQPAVKAPSLIGQKIGTYRIEKLLGAGGMGQVYLAFDEKLRRNVALKILPTEYGKNDERVRRFELEARAISKLNHPNIVTIYDVGNADGIYYIATEFVEGKTLRDLSAGRFKLRNVMANSIQICDALSAAHAEGIIHRDIKPENVMIRKDGYAKILDFGIAKLSDVGSETMSQIGGNTVKGVMIGTPAYMSPAQISGDKIDHRTDIWSAGVVLYEFLTGKNPFKGGSRQETFEAILSKKPVPPSSINPEVPPEVDAILEKLFSREKGGGYATTNDLRADLKAIKRELDSSETGDLHSGSSRSLKRARRARPPYYSYAAALLLLGVLVSGYFFFLRGRSTTEGADWAAATSIPITNQVGTEYFPSLSPDGKDIVYAAEEKGQFDIFILRVGGKKPVNLTPNSPDDDTMPAFSPKGDLIAFRSNRKPEGIYTVEPSGDNLKRVADFGYHPSWSPDGKQIVVSTWGRDQPTVRPDVGMSLDIVDVATGSRRELTKIEATHPAWSPNGHRIAYWFYTGNYGRRDIATLPADGGEPVIVAKDFAVSNWNPVWSPDGKFLYFVSSRSGNLNFWRVAINERTGVVAGDPEPVVTQSNFSRHLTFSRDGKRMAYVQTRNTANIQGVNFDSSTLKPVGEPFWITKGDREIVRPELSTDGTRFVMRLIRPTQDDIVTVNRDGTEWRDVTNDEPFDRYIRWSPDGKQLAFSSDRNGGGKAWVSNADGTGMKQITFSNEENLAAGFPVWSPDGKKIAVSLSGTTFLVDPATGERLFTLPPPPDSQRMAPWDWSPDGKKLAGIIIGSTARYAGYYSFETGTYETVSVVPETIPVAWLRDNRHLIYASGNDKVLIADIQTKKVRDLFSNPNVQIRTPFISSDGKLLYYGAANYESDIWMLDLTGKP
jgi:serine/threonine protein kinase/tricorn protease-like protein